MEVNEIVRRLEKIASYATHIPGEPLFVLLSLDNGIALMEAIDLLKMQKTQETRHVHHYSRPGVYADLWLHCEKCGGVVDDRHKFNFCPWCGRKVKWND